jgi:L-alanine-DL-glutamate epimerase-like enolase superfamily enzyme
MTDFPKVVIEKIDLYWGQVPVECRFSYGDQTTFSFLLVCLHSGRFQGWGETLLAFDAGFPERAKNLLGLDARELDSALLSEGEVADKRLEACSIAAYDLVARVRGVPFYAVLGKPQRRQVPLMPCIFPRNPDHAAQRAGIFTAVGFKHLKVKLIGDPEEDLAVIRKIRKVISPDIPLQGDVNLGYQFKDLQNGLLVKLKTAGLNILEDPCISCARELAQLRSPDHPLIMIDVPARSEAKLKEILEAGGTDLVNLHPCHQGTFRTAFSRARLCDTYGIPAWIGGTGYVGVGTAAYQHLAAIIGVSGPCGELGGSTDHGMPTGLCEILSVRQGACEIPPGAGHGVRPNLSLLKSYLTGRERIIL